MNIRTLLLCSVLFSCIAARAASFPASRWAADQLLNNTSLTNGTAGKAIGYTADGVLGVIAGITNVSEASAYIQANVLLKEDAPSLAAANALRHYRDTTVGLSTFAGDLPVIETLGYAAAGDGGGAVFVYSSTNLFTATNRFAHARAAGGYWINRRVLEDREIDPREAGAVPNDGVDDYAVFQHCSDAAMAFYPSSGINKWGYRCTLKVPAGLWLIEGGTVTYVPPKDEGRGLDIVGDGKTSTYFQTSRTNGTPVFYWGGGNSTIASFSGFTVIGNGGAYTEYMAWRTASGMHLYNVSWWTMNDVLFKYLGTGLMVESWDLNWCHCNADFWGCNTGIQAIRAQAGIWDNTFLGCAVSIYGVVENGSYRINQMGGGRDSSTPYNVWVGQGSGLNFAGSYGEDHNLTHPFAIGWNHTNNVTLEINGTACDVVLTNIHVFGTTNRIPSVVLNSAAATGADAAILNKTHTIVAGQAWTNKVRVTLSGAVTGDYSGVVFTAKYNPAYIGVDGAAIRQATAGSNSRPLLIGAVNNPEIEVQYRGSLDWEMPVIMTSSTVNPRLRYVPLSYGKLVETSQAKLFELYHDPDCNGFTNLFSPCTTLNASAAVVSPGFGNTGRAWSLTASGGNGWLKGDIYNSTTMSNLFGQRVLLGAWVKSTTTGDDLQALQLRNSADDTSFASVTTSTFTDADTWMYVYGVGTVPLASGKWRLYMQVANGATVTIDAISITHQSGFTEYERPMYRDLDFSAAIRPPTAAVLVEASRMSTYSMPPLTALFQGTTTGAATNYTIGIRANDGTFAAIPRWRGSSTTEPAAPIKGDFWVDTSAGTVVKVWDGGAWITLAP